MEQRSPRSKQHLQRSASDSAMQRQVCIRRRFSPRLGGTLHIELCAFLGTGCSVLFIENLSAERLKSVEDPEVACLLLQAEVATVIPDRFLWRL